MRKLTREESVAFVKAEKRRQMAAHIRLRVAANQGAIHFINDLLISFNSAPPRTRAKLEPELVAHKAHLLAIVRGLRPLVDFFKHAQRQQLDRIEEAP